MGEVVKRDLTRQELSHIVRMESNITRIAQKSYQFKQLNCILAAITSYRHITATKRLKQQTISNEMEKTLKRIFEIAVNVHTNHRPAMFNKWTISSIQKDKFTGFCGKLRRFFENCFETGEFIVKNLEVDQDEELLLHIFTENIPKYLSILKGQAIYVIDYKKDEVVVSTSLLLLYDGMMLLQLGCNLTV
jgi:hypothetical protein